MHLLRELERELDKLSNQAKFIRMIVDGELVISKKKKAVLVQELRSKKFKPIPKVSDARKEGEFEPAAQDDADAEDGTQENEGASDYDYLLGVSDNISCQPSKL